MMNDPAVRSIVFQVVLLGLVVFVGWYLFHNTTQNLASRNIASGFGFLEQPAGFDIIQSLIPFSQSATYGDAFVVALLNTLLISAIGIVIATVVGFVVGIARLSDNWIVARLATVYVETLRNIPLLLQIFFWYFAVLRALPGPRDSYTIMDVFFLNQRGFYGPAPVMEDGFWTIPVALILGIAIAVAVSIWAKKRLMATGKQFHSFWVGLAVIIGLPVLAALVTGVPFTWEYPALKGFNFQGGVVMIPEFMAVLFALSLYTASFIAEVVRSGILAVSKGQSEAAHALGIRQGLTLRLVVIPQALRVMIPPLTSQYLNLLKNSSLGAAVGYPELVAVVAGTVLNQTGQAIEVIALTMAVYLTFSLLISLFMNWYNARKALVER
ncbi:amino acid ABC transporter permease [Zavarzinia compransoris]|uniref:amino acid ABC transporter permease n=1 Tax=Zavarzinia marina TaxID=2911065 RepID=UPI001F48A176|nr:amino acid ABC transporter permease [Zavarzinia marina]MCF4164281.1 amino acid ABC transporter permease [Zavarzinia marina]